MNDDNNIDLLDLDDTADDSLPAATSAFATPRPRRPWLLLGVGVLVIILATYIIVRTIGGTSSSSVTVDLDAPEITVDGPDAPTPDVITPNDSIMPPPPPVAVVPPMPAPEPQPAPAPVKPSSAPAPAAAPTPAPSNVGTPVRVIEDRRDVKFNPNKPSPAAKPTKSAHAPKPAPKTAKASAPANRAAPRSAWYVQFGSYGTRAAAESAQRKMQSGHSNLFAGHQFVILAAQLPNGTTTHRLRVGFADSAAANGFCRNAKSDGLDCYVAK
ncbi:MAG: SPOR domain-containing protein [Alphaproteobacteria bacterium]|nr:SPOR domain-containing protein [Alphaproteobacteria bacterium]